MCITHRASYRSKPGVDEVPGLVLSDGYFGSSWDGKIYGEGTGEGDPTGISQVIEDAVIQGPDGEVLGTTNGVSGRRKNGGSSMGKALGIELGTEGGYYDGTSDGNIVREIEVS